MHIIRTPGSRFKSLKDYPFKENYIDVDGLRMHYVDEGASKTSILMLHGEPSWSYLYRHVIPICVSHGYRVVAPDLIGFGKSDKPLSVKDYSFQSHMNWMTHFIKKINLTDIVLVGQDWGSLIGLRLAAENEENFSGIIIGNGMLPTGDQKISYAFKIWRLFTRYSPWFPVDRIINLASKKKLDMEERRAYRAPFPSSKFKAGARAFPMLVPITPKDPATEANRNAWKILEKWEKPFLTTFSDGDPITRGGDKYLCERIPGSKGQKHVTLHGGHFFQEDSGKQLANIIVQFIRDNKL